MPELGVEEIRKLARGFLTGTAEPKELENMQSVLDEDPQMGLELLTQVQSAMDETAPTQLSPDQWSVIDEKIAALFEPLAGKRRGFNPFGFVKRLFKRSKKRKVTVVEEEDDVLPLPDVEDAPPSDEMAPIAPMAAEADETPSPPNRKSAPVQASVVDSDDGDEMAPIAPADDLSAAVDEALDRGDEKRAKKKSGGLALARLARPAAALLLVALVVGGGWMGWQRWGKAWLDKPEPAPKAAPAAVPTPLPDPTAEPSPTPGPVLPQRGGFYPAEPVLPSEVAPATPVPAGWPEPLGEPQGVEQNGAGRLPFGKVK